MDTLVYELDKKLYINLTNQCSNDCDFCIRNHSDGIEDYYLWLSKEPTAKDIISAIEEKGVDKYSEAVFCGFGEPLYALEVMLEVAKYLKEHGYKTRVNTNGQADLICGKGVAKRFKGLIDVVNISLNEASADKYQSVCHSIFGTEGYDAMIKFASEVKDYAQKVVFSVVDTISKEDIETCRKIAESVGVDFRVREYIK